MYNNNSIPAFNEWSDQSEGITSNRPEDEKVSSLLTESLDNGQITERQIIEWINNPVSESAIGKILGGLSGFALGKRIGKILAKALGIQKGILYDLLTSKLFATQVGVVIGKRII